MSLLLSASLHEELRFVREVLAAVEEEEEVEIVKVLLSLSLSSFSLSVRGWYCGLLSRCWWMSNAGFCSSG